MPPLNLPRLTQTMRQLPRLSQGLGGGSGLTDSQRELMPFVQEAEAERSRKVNLLQPVEMIFDLLSRPQYITANIAQEFIDLLRGQDGRPGAAALQGLTGQRKGNFETVLFGGQDVGGDPFEGLVPIEDEKGGGRQLIRGVGGFAANVLFDPLTYVGLGPTRRAQAAAQKFAQRAIKQQFRRTSSIAQLRKALPDVADDVVRMLDVDPDQAVRLLRDKGGEDFAKVIDQSYRKAQREGLTLTADQAGERFMREITEEQDELLGSLPKSLAERYQARRLKSKQTSLGKANAVGDSKKAGKLRREIESIRSDNYIETMTENVSSYVRGTDVAGLPKGILRMIDEHPGMVRMRKLLGEAAEIERGDFATALTGLGERAVNIMGKEVGASVRPPNMIARGMSQLRGQFQQSRPGAAFSEAWWSVMNRGPIGAIRQVLGFRNPYQRMLRELELTNRAELNVDAQEAVSRAMAALGDSDDVILEKYFDVMSQSEALGIRPMDALLDPDTVARLGVDDASRNQILQVASDVKKWTDEIRGLENRWAAAGFNSDVALREAYLPSIMQELGIYKRAPKQKGSFSPRPTQARRLTIEQRSAQESAKLQLLLGLGPDEARQLVLSGGSTQVTNVRELLAYRALGHAKMKSRVGLLEKFREFGVDIRELQPRAVVGEAVELRELRKQQLWGSINGHTGLQQLGLQPVSDPYFRGMVFDREVKDILDRAVTVIDNDEGTATLKRLMRQYSGWWKAVVTSTPGFHMRNMYSNNVTGFLRHGFAWFNVLDQQAAFAGTVKALHGESGLEKLRGVFGRVHVQRLLQRRYGGRSVDDWSDLALRNGVISRNVMAADREQTIQRLAGTEAKTAQRFNPFNREFGFYQWSEGLGAIVESSPRMQTFLMDIGHMAKEGEATEAMVEWAKANAKKWFLDYTDLTRFEQGVMKNVIPFYSWMRKNLSNQILGIIETPYMYAIIPKATAAAQSGPTDNETLPAWMRNFGMFPIGESDSGNPIMFRPNFPYQDLNIIPVVFEANEGALLPRPAFSFQETIRDVSNAAHPMLKTFVSLATGKDLFFERDLDRPQPAPRFLRVLTNSPGVLNLLDGMVRTAIPGGNGLNLGMDDQGRLMMDPRVEQILENNVPVLKRMAEWFDMPIMVAEALGVPVEQAIEAATGAKDDYDGLEEVFQVLSRNFGVKMKVLDEEQAEQDRAYEVYKEAEAKRRNMRETLPGFQQRSLRATRRQQSTFRKLGLVR